MLKGLVAFFGRLLLSLIFLVSGVHIILDWQGSEQLIINALTFTLSQTTGIEWIQHLLELALSFVPLFLTGAVICEILGALCVILGIQVRLGAFLLILFLIPTTLLMHPFWSMPGSEQEMQKIMFIKNISILGGLLVLLAYGHGRSGGGKKGSSPEA